jgi:aryl-alcohol dehydrogenase-like predicted oxidoreductase
LGGWVTYGGQVGEELALKCMEEAWKHGINFFDSAEVYAEGKCEVAMGKAIKTLGWKREDFVMSTKLFWGAVWHRISIADIESTISQPDWIEPKALARRHGCIIETSPVGLR